MIIRTTKPKCLRTNTEFAPWLVIKANKKMRARVEVIQKLLEIIPYASDDSKK
jgi:polyphosphate kinase 2 (PPK2 family)